MLAFGGCLEDKQGRVRSGVLNENPSHSAADLFGACIQAVASDPSESPAVAVSPGVVDRGFLAGAELGQGLRRALPKGLFRFGGVDRLEPNLYLFLVN